MGSSGDEEGELDLSGREGALALKKKLVGLSGLYESHRKLTKWNSSLRTSYFATAKELGEAQDKLKEAHEKLAETRVHNESLLAELNRLEAWNAELVAEAEALEREADVLEDELDDLRRERPRGDDGVSVEVRRDQVQRLKAQITKKTQKHLLAQRKTADLDKQIAELKEVEGRMKVTFDRLHATVPHVVNHVKSVMNSGAQMTKAEQKALEMLELYLEGGFEEDDGTGSEDEAGVKKNAPSTGKSKASKEYFDSDSSSADEPAKKPGAEDMDLRMSDSDGNDSDVAE